MGLYIGLMSGTSLDGVDGVLADFHGSAWRVKGHHHEPFGVALRDELLALNASAGTDELHRASLAANAVSRAYASVVTALLFGAGATAQEVRAIGAHGQTVRHRPGEFDGSGYTVQLLNGALLAEATGIDVVCDLRSRDVAAGGQGAPLAPAFHAAAFGDDRQVRAVLNLGGIANLTVLAPGRPVRGFDCGPANALMDAWCLQHTGRPYDEGGAWAARGRVVPALLEAMLAEPYFALPPPKSTGRDLFGMDWLASNQAAVSAAMAATDVQATLAQLTVETVARDLERHAPETAALFVCGGGARNDRLLQLLAKRLPDIDLRTTEALGLPVDQVEAAAFAWLAHRFVERLPGNLPEVTGSRGPRLLGALYPA